MTAVRHIAQTRPLKRYCEIAGRARTLTHSIFTSEISLRCSTPWALTVFVFPTGFVGCLPTNPEDERQAHLCAVRNADDIEHVAR